MAGLGQMLRRHPKQVSGLCPVAGCKGTCVAIVAGNMRSACMKDAFDGALHLLCQLMVLACAF